MRSIFAYSIICISLAAPLVAQELPTKTISATQQSLQRAHMLRYGTRLLEAFQKYGFFDQLMDLATPDQIDSLRKIRISPSQARQLLQQLRENSPDGPLDKDGLVALRRKLTPKFEDILGSEQFDLLLSLIPSPQQTEQATRLLKSVAGTPEGQLALQAANELSKSLTEDQRSFLKPFLELMQDPGSPAVAVKMDNPVAKDVAASRLLVYLKKTSLGDSFAEISPDNQFTYYMPQRYRIKGADPDVLANLSSSDGLPVRVTATINSDVLTLPKTNLLGPPAILAVSGDYTCWRGKLPARVVSQTPPVVLLTLGRNQSIQAGLDLQTDQERKKFKAYSSSGGFLLGATALTAANGSVTLCDLDFSDWRAPVQVMDSGASVQLSEDFLNHAASAFLSGHSDEFAGGKGNVHFEVKQIGATLLGCQPGQVRLYGRLVGSHTGLEVLGGRAEVVCNVATSKGNLELKPVAGSLKLGLDYPFCAALPDSWITNIEHIGGSEYIGGSSIVVINPEIRQQIIDSGALSQEQLDSLHLASAPTADRRTSLMTVVAPNPAGANVVAVDVLKNRIQTPGEFSLAVAEATINQAIQAKLPPMLPITRPVPKQYQKQGGATLTDIEIPQLEVEFNKGQFNIKTCVVNVHWSFGLFSGVEPGCRFQGSAKIVGVGEPAHLGLQLHIDQLEFLSSHVTGMAAADQQELKDKLIKGLQEYTIELPALSELKIKALAPDARLVLTGAGATSEPSELLMYGRIQP